MASSLQRPERRASKAVAAALRLTCVAVIAASAVGVPAGAESVPAASQVAPPGPSIAAMATSDFEVCDAAATDAEAHYGLPAGILRAVGRAESGRRDSTGRISAWPWTINAGGPGTWFASRPEATAAVRALLAQGTRAVDVGCFQVNLAWHPHAFASLEDAFDPAANAAYAAGCLAELRTRLGSWEAAVANYHSSTLSLGLPYRDRVFAGWTGPGDRPAPVPAFGVRIWGPGAPGTAPSWLHVAPSASQVRAPAVVAGAAPLPG
jgi:hypothetical protein